jgi:hypothetical protein
MATFNAESSTNNVNQVVWGWQTTLELRTDRAAGSVARHGLVSSIQNLGVGVSTGDPFTLLS